MLWQSPHVRASLSALIALLAIGLIVGCGGGGGNGNNGNGGNVGGTNNGGGGGPAGQDPNLPYVSGRIGDTSSPSQGVVGATVVLSGPGVPDLTTRVTNTDGTFVIANVSTAYTTISVMSPDTSKWYNYALYASKQYDTINCRLPLPALSIGNNNLSTSILLFSATNNPPPPPLTTGCP